jgi:hypothetical protein
MIYILILNKNKIKFINFLFQTIFFYFVALIIVIVIIKDSKLN